MTRGGGLSVAEIVRVFGPFLRPHWAGFLLSVVLVLAGTAASLLRPWPLKYLFDDVLVPSTVAGGPTGRMQLVLLAVVTALALVALLDSVLSFARSYVLTKLGESVSTSLRTSLYAHLQRLSLGYHQRQRAGDLLTRVTSDVDKVQSLVTSTVIDAGANVLTLVGMLGVMFVLDWQLSAVMVILIPLLIVTVQRFRRRIRLVETGVRQTEGDLASIAQETFAAVKLVKAYGREDHEAGRFRRISEDNLAAELRVTRVTGVFSIALDLVTAVALAGLLWLGAQRVLSGHLTAGDLVIFSAYLRDFISPTRALARLGASLSRASVRAEKIAEVLREQPAVTDRPEAVSAGELSGRLELRSVSFGYDEASPVLHEINLSVSPGQVVAVVGPTGAGKSTLVGLLCRLHDPSAGQVIADGRDVRDYTLASYQANVAVVLQGAVLFGSSVRDNIAYGRPGATEEEIEAAARVASAHDFVMALPDGYDTVLGERGDTLSGGQRQRIAIARAVLRDAPILVLDEPTTGLDARSERDVLAALQRVTAGRATVLISHQLAAVRHADVIVVLHEGRVVERGRHDQLMALGGRYAEMAGLQGLAPGPSRNESPSVSSAPVAPSTRLSFPDVGRAGLGALDHGNRADREGVEGHRVNGRSRPEREPAVGAHDGAARADDAGPEAAEGRRALSHPAARLLRRRPVLILGGGVAGAGLGAAVAASAATPVPVAAVVGEIAGALIAVVVARGRGGRLGGSARAMAEPAQVDVDPLPVGAASGRVDAPPREGPVTGRVQETTGPPVLGRLSSDAEDEDLRRFADRVLTELDARVFAVLEVGPLDTQIPTRLAAVIAEQRSRVCLVDARGDEGDLAALLGTGRVAERLCRACVGADLVLLQVPNAQTPHAVPLAAAAGAVLLLAVQGKSRRELDEVAAAVAEGGARVFGLAFIEEAAPIPAGGPRPERGPVG